MRIIKALQPFDLDLDPEKKHNYQSFPKLDPSLYMQPRAVENYLEETMHNVKRVVDVRI